MMMKKCMLTFIYIMICYGLHTYSKWNTKFCFKIIILWYEYDWWYDSITHKQQHGHHMYDMVHTVTYYNVWYHSCTRWFVSIKKKKTIFVEFYFIWFLHVYIYILLWYNDPLTRQQGEGNYNNNTLLTTFFFIMHKIIQVKL